MLAHYFASVMLCAQICPVCFPNSIDTLISLIQPNLAELWSRAYKHIQCMIAGLRAPSEVCVEILGLFSQFHSYLYLSNWTRIGGVIKLLIL